MNGFKNCFFFVVSCFLLIACVEIPQYQNADASTGEETSGEVSSSADASSVDSADSVSQDSSVVAEVEVTKPPVGSCVDQDKDGYCDKATTPDCNDLDSSINPAATEKCGDSKDNNCNGQTDEGCSNPTPTASNTVSVKVSYPSAVYRKLMVYPYGSKADVFTGWTKTVTGTGTSLELVVDVSEFTCGITVNVANGELVATATAPAANEWVCKGNGTDVKKDPNATFEVKWGSKTFGNSEILAYPTPNNAGCAIVVPFKTAGVCAL